MTDTIYKGRGTKSENSKLVDTINNVFSPERQDNFNFYNLLPKLYKDKHNPAEHNFIVREGEEIKGCVGLYYETLNVGDKKILCGGIGNVAVTLDSRSKGYMIDCMNLALEDMIKSKAEISFLGGQRQRYAYFSYEQGGQAYSFRFSMRNMHHVYGKDADTDFEIHELKEDDYSYLDAVYSLHTNKPYHFDRSREELYDILTSWEHVPQVITKNGEFKGYCIFGGGGTDIDELTLADNSDIKDAVLAILSYNPGVTMNISLPLYEKKLIKFFSDTAESCTLRNAECITVLNFRSVLEKLLRFKASYTLLCDTECTLLIHGKARDERIHISVKSNDVSVTDSYRTPEIELDHLTAIRLFFGICPPRTDEIPADFKAILPVPFFVAGADNV